MTASTRSSSRRTGSQMDTTKEGRAPGTGSSSLTQLCGARKALLSTADTLSAVSPSGTSHQESSLFSQETISLPSTMADCCIFSLLQSHQLLSLQLVLNQLQRLTKNNVCQKAFVRNPVQLSPLTAFFQGLRLPPGFTCIKQRPIRL